MPAGSTPRTITPAQRVLTLVTFAPAANVSNPTVVTPAVAQLTLTGATPDVSGDLQQGGFGYAIVDNRPRFGPMDEEEQAPVPVLISPPSARLRLATHPPTIAKNSSVAFTLDELSALAGEFTAEEFAVLLAA